VAAAASKNNSEPPKTLTDSPRPSTSTSKEEIHPSSPEDIRPLPKDGHRGSECKHAEKKAPKKIKKSKNASDTRIFCACTILTHILEVRPETCGFSAQIASCGQMKYALLAVPALFAHIASQMDRNTV
jgi:hypothetical protein